MTDKYSNSMLKEPIAKDSFDSLNQHKTSYNSCLYGVSSLDTPFSISTKTESRFEKFFSNSKIRDSEKKLSFQNTSASSYANNDSKYKTSGFSFPLTSMISNFESNDIIDIINNKSLYRPNKNLAHLTADKRTKEDSILSNKQRSKSLDYNKKESFDKSLIQRSKSEEKQEKTYENRIKMLKNTKKESDFNVAEYLFNCLTKM